jgi:hypothetical protein
MPASTQNLETGTPAASLRASRSAKGPDRQTPRHAADPQLHGGFGQGEFELFVFHPQSTLLGRSGSSGGAARHLFETLGARLKKPMFPLRHHSRTHADPSGRLGAVISPASTDSTMRVFSSAAIFVRRDLVAILTTLSAMPPVIHNRRPCQKV